MMRWVLIVLALAGFGVRPAAAETSCGQLVRETYWVCKAHGAGDPILFIHGALSDGRVWQGQIEAAARTHYLAIPSLRHHGTSSTRDPEPYSHAMHVEDLADLLVEGGTPELRGRPVHVVGQGFGAEIALLLVRRVPARVRSLVLDEPDFPSLVADLPDGKPLLAEREEQLGWVRAAAYEGHLERGIGAFVRWLGGGDARAQTMGGNADDLGFMPPASRDMFLRYRHTLAPHLTMPPPALTCAELGALKLPVLVTMGQKTRPYFRRAAETVASCIPGARLAAIADAGHGAPFENPAAFNRELLEFLAKQ